MNDKYYREILASLDESLRVIGDMPAGEGSARRVYSELRKLRETLIRAQRDTLDRNVRRDKRDSRSPMDKRDSRSPMGVQ